MKTVLFILLAVLLSTPGYAEERKKEREVKIERFFNDSIRRDRARDDSRYRNQRRPYCVTYKVTDEYGYVEYFQRCR